MEVLIEISGGVWRMISIVK